MSDPTDEAFARLQARSGSATVDPTEAAFAKMQAKVDPLVNEPTVESVDDGQGGFIERPTENAEAILAARRAHFAAQDEKPEIKERLARGEFRDPVSGFWFDSKADYIAQKAPKFSVSDVDPSLPDVPTWLAPAAVIADRALRGIEEPVDRLAHAKTFPQAARGVIGTGIGAVSAALGPAVTGSQLLNENPDANAVAQVAGRVARWTPIPVPLGAFEAYGEHVIAPLDKAAEDEKRLVQHGTPTFAGLTPLVETAALAGEAAPFLLAGAKGTPRLRAAAERPAQRIAPKPAEPLSRVVSPEEAVRVVNEMRAKERAATPAPAPEKAAPLSEGGPPVPAGILADGQPPVPAGKGAAFTGASRTPAEHLAAVEDLRQRHGGALSRRDATEMLARQDAAAAKPDIWKDPEGTGGEATFRVGDREVKVIVQYTGDSSAQLHVAADATNQIGTAGMRGIFRQVKEAFPEVTEWQATGGAKPQRSFGSGRRMGSESGAVRVPTAREIGKGAKAAEGWIETAEKPINKVTGKLGAKLKATFPRAADVTERAYNKLLRSAEANISPDFERAVLEGRGSERLASHDSALAVRAFRDATKELTDAQRAEVGKSLSSQAADLSTLAPDVRAAVEKTRAALQDLRSREVAAGTLSPEAFAEYPEGHLKRVLKPGNIAERVMGRRGGVRVAAYETAADMHNFKPRIDAEKAKALAEGLDPRYLKQEGETTLVKFTDDAAGLKAADAFEARLAEAGIKPERTPPIPQKVAETIFEGDTAKRLHVTMQESARRIGKADTLANIAKAKDADGSPLVIEPKDVGAAAKGIEKPPEGFKFISNEKMPELSGKFVKQKVADYVEGAFDPKAKGFWNGLSQGLMESFKKAKLLWNPRQWVRQIPSNMEFENLMGFSNWNPRYLQHKTRGLKAMGKSSPYHRALVENGFLEPAFVSEAELGLVERTLGSKEGDLGLRVGRAIGTLGMTELAPGKLKATEAKLGRAYAFADAWTKASGYVFAIEEMGMSPKDAAAYVRRWTPSPESVSDVVKGYSRSVLGDPWARFRAEQARINLQAAGEKPIRLAMNRAQKNLIRGAAVTLGASALSDDEETALENEQGEGALALGRNEAGEPLALDYSFLSTLGDFFDTPSEVGKSGEHVVDRALQVTGLGDNPLYSVLGEQISRHDRYGRPINPEGTLSGAAYSAGASLLKNWLPALATNHRQKLLAAWKGEPFSPNQPVQTKEQAVLDVFFGFKLTPLQAEQALQKIQRQGARAARDIASMFQGQAIRGEEIDSEKAAQLAEALAAEYAERAAPLERIQMERMGAGK